MASQSFVPRQSELGKKSTYTSLYNPDILFPIARSSQRIEIGVDSSDLPFKGFDYWNHYEVSWLNEWGKPIVALAEIVYDCQSTYMIESKSLKLYFNTLNNTRFKTLEDVTLLVKKDLSMRMGTDVFVAIMPIETIQHAPLVIAPQGVCLDSLDIDCFDYTTKPSLLTTESDHVEERLYSNLLKSNCLVTHQPDWGTIEIHYEGKKINRAHLLAYIISYRNHYEFHEQCIERIFMDVMTQCQPNKLTVYGRYTRRGGLDINPYRSTEASDFKHKNIRLIRQ